MTEQQPPAAGGEPQSDGGIPVVEMSRPFFSNEWFFNREVHQYATHHGWRPFHVDGFSVRRGRGFPDLAMFRKNEETDEYEMLVAELKRDANSEFGEGQEEWLEAFRQMGMTTKIWFGDSETDLAEMYDVIEKGTSGHESVTRLPPAPSSPIPARFRDVMTNIIEDIESNEMSTGEKASLRRMEPGSPNSTVFWRLMSQRGMPRDAEIRKWGLIMHGIALMAHTAGHAHNPRLPVGKTLYEGNGNASGFYSEKRLSTLLSAGGEALHSLLARLFRMLAGKSCAFNWHEMAWFILHEGCREEEADKSRIKITRAYYLAEQRNGRRTEERS